MSPDGGAVVDVVVGVEVEVELMVVLELVEVLELEVGVVGLGLTRSSALTRNEAICPRVTGRLGQYRVLAGGLHPLVTPSA